MKNNFDELARTLAQSTSRRRALKKLALGIIGMGLGCLGLENRARAGNSHGYCEATSFGQLTGNCIAANCLTGPSSACKGSAGSNIGWSPCGQPWATQKKCSF